MAFEIGGYIFFFFKQKTAYEMRISDWSSDVCSSDLTMNITSISVAIGNIAPLAAPIHNLPFTCVLVICPTYRKWRASDKRDRKSVVKGKSVSGRVDLGGRRILKQTKKQ